MRRVKKPFQPCGLSTVTYWYPYVCCTHPCLASSAAESRVDQAGASKLNYSAPVHVLRTSDPYYACRKALFATMRPGARKKSPAGPSRMPMRCSDRLTTKRVMHLYGIILKPQVLTKSNRHVLGADIGSCEHECPLQSSNKGLFFLLSAGCL